jgi:hypothetical protein
MQVGTSRAEEYGAGGTGHLFFAADPLSWAAALTAPTYTHVITSTRSKGISEEHDEHTRNWCGVKTCHFSVLLTLFILGIQSMPWLSLDPY